MDIYLIVYVLYREFILFLKCVKIDDILGNKENLKKA